MNEDRQPNLDPVKTKNERIQIRYPIWAKIFLGSLLPALVLIAAALLYHQNLDALGKSASQILSQNYKSIQAAEQARKAIEETRNLSFEQMSRGVSPVLRTSEALARIESDQGLDCPEVRYLIEFMRSSQRGVLLRRGVRRTDDSGTE